MRTRRLDAIDLLKIDIEGAERHVFEDAASACLDRVGTVAIELHDAASREVFLRATSAIPGDVSDDGELTVWRARSPTPRATAYTVQKSRGARSARRRLCSIP